MQNTYKNVPARRPSLNRPFGIRPLLICACLIGSTAYAQTQSRTVIDKEQGSIFQEPEGFSWSDYGLYDGTPQSLDPSAIWVEMAHFDQFYPAEDNTPYGIPYSKLRAYESQQVAEGKPPIFITATYQGKKRPVYFEWSLSLVNGKPTAASNQWQYAVNVQDTRFIHFWINHYIQPLLAKTMSSSRTHLTLQLDECAFLYSLYGVLDDNNHFVSGVTWDSPFPQNQAQFETGIETFFGQVKTALAPNINVIVNVGTQANPSHFPTIFANVPAIFTENVYAWVSAGDSAYSRNSWYEQNFQYFPWMASQNRVTMMRAEVPAGNTGDLLSSFVIYELLKGMNSFFAPGDLTGKNTISWQAWAAQLGYPTGAMTASAPTSLGTGFRLFSRTYQDGIVYLNGTGSTQTVQLNPSTTYYDHNGNQITSHAITLLDGTGAFVTTAPHAIPPPEISPRYGSAAIGPVSVTLTSSTSGATIRYTTNGSTPTSSSPAYTGPISVSSSEVVSARAFSGSNSSLASTASYTISASPLTAQFFLSSDSGLSGSYYPVVQLSAIPKGSVEVFYSVKNGTPANGTYTFLPGNVYGILPITTGSSGATTVTLTGATGAELGSKDVLSYTIVK